MGPGAAGMLPAPGPRDGGLPGAGGACCHLGWGHPSGFSGAGRGCGVGSGVSRLSRGALWGSVRGLRRVGAANFWKGSVRCQRCVLSAGTPFPGGQDPRGHPGLRAGRAGQGTRPGPAVRSPHGQRKGPLSTGTHKGFLCLVPLCPLSPPRCPSIASTQTAPEF